MQVQSIGIVDINVWFNRFLVLMVYSSRFVNFYVDNNNNIKIMCVR